MEISTQSLDKVKGFRFFVLTFLNYCSLLLGDQSGNYELNEPKLNHIKRTLKPFYLSMLTKKPKKKKTKTEKEKPEKKMCLKT